MVSTVVSLAIMPYTSQNNQVVFSIASNSTVTDLEFNSTSRQLSFTVSGPSGTTGYVDAYIAKTLIGDISTLKVYLDGAPLPYNATSQGDSWLIYFTYHHSTHSVVMSLGQASTKPVTETSTETITAASIAVVVAIALILAVTILKRRQRNKQE